MKSKFYFLLLLSLILLSFTTDKFQKFDAELVDIQFYSVNTCNQENSIYIRVVYEVDYKNLSSLKMKQNYDNDISSTIPVNYFDKKGHVIYDFCSLPGINKSFTTIFIDTKGRESNPVTVNIDFSKAEIISGTAPQVISIN
jgi:hypothetical protein